MPNDSLTSPMKGTDHREIAGVIIDVAPAGDARVRRVIHPPGFRWSRDMKPAVGTQLCMRAHVGFLASGELHVQYADGCRREYKAPQVVAIDPGHDAWVVGDEPAVTIEIEFEHETARKLGMPDEHRH